MGKSIADFYGKVGRDDAEIIAVMRREHVLLPHPDTLLEPNDRLMLIATPESLVSIKEDIVPLPNEEQAMEPLEKPGAPLSP